MTAPYWVALQPLRSLLLVRGEGVEQLLHLLLDLGVLDVEHGTAQASGLHSPVRVLLVGGQQAESLRSHLRRLPGLLRPAGHENVVALTWVLPEVVELGHDVSVLGRTLPADADVPDRLPFAESDGARDQLGLGHVEPVVTRRRSITGQQRGLVAAVEDRRLAFPVFLWQLQAGQARERRHEV